MGAQRRMARLVGTVVVGGLAVAAVPSAAGAATQGAEHFRLVFSSQTAPGAIFASGVFSAGGTDYQGNRTDEAAFPDGAFAIRHGAIHPTFTFNAKTCTGHLSGSGPYRLSNGFGAYEKIKSTGTAHLQGSLATGRNPNGTCNFHDETAYSLLVVASGPVSF